MKKLTFAEVFNIFHGGEENGAAIAWDGYRNFAYIKHLNVSYDDAEWEIIEISDLNKTNDNAEEILAAYNHRYCGDFETFLRTLFSSRANTGFLIWHADGSGHEFAITRNSNEKLKSWGHQPEGWSQWVRYGEGDYLGRCKPGE